MRHIRLTLSILIAGIALTALFVGLRGFGLLEKSSLARVKSVPRGDREIAWFHTSTNLSTWERFVAGARRLQKEWPELELDERNAFLEQTTGVPEIALRVKGCDAKLWLRWYKLTSDAGVDRWVEALAERDPAPLAIIGGGSSDRALDLARVMNRRTAWRGERPLLFITTATADEVLVEEKRNPFISPTERFLIAHEYQDLMSVYPERSFRLCFTNRQMADAVVDFVWGRPELRPHGSPNPSLPATAAAFGATGDVWSTLGALTEVGQLQKPLLFTLGWADDPYSIDLAEQFVRVFARPEYRPNQPIIEWIAYSVGEYLTPNPPEAEVAGHVMADLFGNPDNRSLLVLPTLVQPARRVLRALAAGAPVEVRDLVAVTGDSINFNNIYRDRNIAWNVQEMPVPLVFFCHQNPIDWPELARGDQPAPYANATDDEMLNADLVRTLVEAVFSWPARPGASPQPASDADGLRERLRSRRPPLFRPDGNRVGGSGEYLVYLRPHFHGGRVLPSASIEVWSRQTNDKGVFWQRVNRQPLRISYGEAGRE
jgi:hypothetical protein